MQAPVRVIRECQSYLMKERQKLWVVVKIVEHGVDRHEDRRAIVAGNHALQSVDCFVALPCERIPLGGIKIIRMTGCLRSTPLYRIDTHPGVRQNPSPMESFTASCFKGDSC